MTEEIAEVLVERGAEVAMPPRSSARLGYRFEMDGEVIEVLGPDGLSADPPTFGALTTIQIAGGTQALRRTEKVFVSLAGTPPKTMRRPDLLGAILLKARAVTKRRGAKFDSDRQDLTRLLTYADDPRGLGADLRGREKDWLRRVVTPLSLDDPTLGDLFSPATLERARQALLLLTAR